MSVNTNKATENDKRRFLSRGIGMDGYLIDYNDSEVFYEKEVYEEGKGYTYITMRAPYTISGVTATVDKEAATEVEKTTEYIDKSVEKSSILLDKLESILEKALGKQEGPSLIEKYNEDDMTSVEPLYVAVGEIDAHGETYLKPEDVYKMVDSFNEANEAGTLKMSLFHLTETKTFSAVKAWVNEEEIELGGQIVPKLQPLVELKFHNKKAYEYRKSLKLTGCSIGCKADFVPYVEEIDSE